MTSPPFTRRARQTFPPEVARRIRIENAGMAVGTVAIWAAIVAGGGGRMMRWW